MDDAPILPARFELIREVGAGGMGVVYEAHDRELGRDVAVKVFHDRSPEMFDRIKQEFRIAAAVRHPGLVRLGELFEHDGSLCFSMELVDGVDLPSWIQGPDRNDRVREAVAQLASALAALHRAGVVHRDVKPSNVLVTRDDRVVLLDLGLATSVGSRTSDTAGTVEYVAPEHVHGGAPTAALDLYALGVTAFELLTGRTPFDGSPAEILIAKSTHAAPRIGSLVRGVPPDLDELVAALLVRDPGQRPTARDVEFRIGSATTPVPRRRRATGRHRTLVGRRDELAALLAVTEEPLPRTTVFLVRGGAGVGKTALLETFAAAAAARGHVVGLGRCAAREHLRYNAWDGLLDALTRYLAALTPDERAALLPPGIGALARLFPALERLGELAYPSGESLDVVAQDAATALRALLRAVARDRRVVSILDDAHLATDESFALLVDVLRAPSPPCVVVFCVRLVATMPPAQQERLQRLRRLPIDLRVLDVRPLGEHDAVALAERLIGDPARARAVGQASLGNPMFVELLAANPTTQAADLGTLLTHQVATLGGDAARVLRALAAAAEPVTQELLGQALGMSHDTLAAVLEPLTEHRLVRLAGVTRVDTCELMHDLIAGAVRTTAADPELVDEHRRLAQAFDELEPGGPRAVEHWAAAGDAGPAERAALALCAEAHDAVAMATAADRCELVLTRVRPAQPSALLAQWAIMLAGAGASERAAEAFLEASRGADGDLRLDLERQAAEHFLRSGRLDDGMQVARRVAAVLGLDLDQSARRLLARITLERVRNRWRGVTLAAVASEADGRRADACTSLSTGLSMLDVVRAAWFTSRGLRHALDSGDPGRAARALALEASLLAARGDRHAQRARDALAQARAFAGQAAAPLTAAMVELAHGLVALQRCDYRDSRDACDRAVAGLRASTTGVSFEQHVAEYFAIVATYWLGAWGELAERKQALLRVAEATRDRFVELSVQTGVGIVGDLIAGVPPGDLRTRVAETMRAWPHERAPAAYLRQVVAATMVERYAGDAAAALRGLAEAWPVLTRTRALHSEQGLATVLAMRGPAALAAGRPSEAAADARALRELPNMAGPAALLEAGVAAAEGGDPRPPLDEAIAACESQGFLAYLAAAQARRARVVGGDAGASARLAATDLAARLGLGDAERAFDFLAPWPR